MTTIGDLPQPGTKVEYLYVIFELVLGLITFATVLGYIANIVTNVSAARKDFQGKPSFFYIIRKIWLRIHWIMIYPLLTKYFKLQPN